MLNVFSVEKLLFSDFYFLLPEVFIFFSILWSMILIIYVDTNDHIDLTLKLNRFFQVMLFLSSILYITLLIQQNWFNSMLICNMSCNITFTGVMMKITLLFLTLILLELYSNMLLHNMRDHTTHYSFILMMTIFFYMMMSSSSNFMTFFIGLIGFSMGMYGLLFKDIEFSPMSREAGMKYYFLSTFSSGLLLYGICLTYYVFNTINFSTIRSWIFYVFLENGLQTTTNILIMCLVFLIMGLLFKMSLFPCHLWTPEIYEGSPDLITAIFILPMKLVTVMIFSQLMTYVYEQLINIWQPILIISSIGSLIWGCFGAIFEPRIKKFLAYTSINQLGFLLIGFICGTENGYYSVYFYLHLYLLMNLIFIVVLFMLKTMIETTTTFITDLTDFQVSIQNKEYPIMLLLMPTIFSMAGIPPLAGFFSKYFMLLEAFKVSMIFPIMIALMTSLFSCYYYMNLMKTMSFDYATHRMTIYLPKLLIWLLTFMNLYFMGGIILI